MNRDKLFELYEKLYFSEIETKDKLHARVQVVFSLIVISVTILTYLTKNISFEYCWQLSLGVVILIFCSFIAIGYSCLRLQKAFWGNKFRYVTTPKELNAYREQLVKYEIDFIEYCLDNDIQYRNEHEPGEVFRKHILNELTDCTDWNTRQNEDRSSEIFESIKWFFISLVPLVLAVAIFLIADLDSASPRKSTAPNYIIIPMENIRRL